MHPLSSALIQLVYAASWACKIASNQTTRSRGVVFQRHFVSILALNDDRVVLCSRYAAMAKHPVKRTVALNIYWVFCIEIRQTSDSIYSNEWDDEAAVASHFGRSLHQETKTGMWDSTMYFIWFCTVLGSKATLLFFSIPSYSILFIDVGYYH